MAENRFGGEQGFQLVEGFLRFGIPFEASTLEEKRRDWDDNARITDNKPAVEVGEAEKDLDFGERAWNRPFGDSSNAINTHTNAIWGDNEPEEINFLDIEFTLLEFDI